MHGDGIGGGATGGAANKRGKADGGRAADEAYIESPPAFSIVRRNSAFCIARRGMSTACTVFAFFIIFARGIPLLGVDIRDACIRSPLSLPQLLPLTAAAVDTCASTRTLLNVNILNICCKLNSTPRMRPMYMRSQVTGLREPMTARIADVGCLARMRPHVRSHITERRERLTTCLTYIGFLI